MNINRRTFVASFSMLVLTGLPGTATAAVSTFDRFNKSTKKELGKIKTAINKVKSHRAKNSDQKKAARKYTINYDRLYGQMKSITKSDGSKLKSGTSKYAGKSTVKGAISRFEMRIKKLQAAQRTIAKDVKKMKRDQKRFWGEVSWFQFGVQLTPSEYKKVVAGVKMFGTAPGARISLDPKKKALRSYKAAISPELTYLKLLSASLGRLIRAYSKALKSLKSKQADMARKSGTKTKRKPVRKPPSPYKKPSEE